MAVYEAKTFTCKACHVRKPRTSLAMYTSQCGICFGCYEEGKRLTIDWESQYYYVTYVCRAQPPDALYQYRGAHLVPDLAAGRGELS